MANGVVLAPNQRSLFVMALLERGVRIYDIAPDGSGDLVNGYHSQFLDLQTMVCCCCRCRCFGVVVSLLWVVASCCCGLLLSVVVGCCGLLLWDFVGCFW